MTTPLLEGLDGVEKMSKSLGNYVGVTEPPAEMFGKIMSISDTVMWRYYLLLTDASEPTIAEWQRQVSSGERHPKQMKVQLARRIVEDFHTAASAAAAAEAFEAKFVRGELVPADLPEVRVATQGGSISLAQLVVATGLASSGSDASRKVQQGGVKVDRQRVSDARARIPSPQPGLVLEVGRRAVRVILE
jgi:tyrosyl-tRNA synthetase